ncbi:Uncharacterised protein [Helicobacter fennelliae]|uniref:Uncharacterized protein n=1 Tax=Helicobacter fennelliae MRY12-0050 TaxID=1325130 RepID=T1DWX5_9HELI|nr:hypothetical protein HFN_1252 [Helicobacter fennelliae MRY12-0050]STP07730.1 Uncharacterised protein [Helicobacter fennelliae]
MLCVILSSKHILIALPYFTRIYDTIYKKQKVQNYIYGSIYRV